ncbi:MAG: PKD domain-containing protein, partial [Flavobacteriales bacterium]
FDHPDSVCQHAPVAFSNASQLATGATWLFGDGASSDAMQPVHAYGEHGQRTVTLVARNGCIRDTARSVIQVMPAGLPSFHVASDPCDERTYFVNTTQGGERFVWDFGDGEGTDSWHQPMHIYRSMGAFEVRLITDPGELCERAYSQTIHAGYGLIPVAWFIPSAFTPNSDGLNDVLRVMGPEPCQSPVMSIHNKWGQLVWEGDADSGWDGTVNGIPAPEGVYAYALRGRREDLRHGWVMLVR